MSDSFIALPYNPHNLSSQSLQCITISSIKTVFERHNRPHTSASLSYLKIAFMRHNHNHPFNSFPYNFTIKCFYRGFFSCCKQKHCHRVHSTMCCCVVFRCHVTPRLSMSGHTRTHTHAHSMSGLLVCPSACFHLLCYSISFSVTISSRLSHKPMLNTLEKYWFNVLTTQKHNVNHTLSKYTSIERLVVECSCNIACTPQVYSQA